MRRSGFSYHILFVCVAAAYVLPMTAYTGGWPRVRKSPPATADVVHTEDSIYKGRPVYADAPNPIEDSIHTDNSQYMKFIWKRIPGEASINYGKSNFSNEKPSFTKIVTLSMQEVLSRALEKDIELKSLSFSMTEFVRSKKNIYRSLFPTVTTSMGATRIFAAGETDTRSHDFSLTLDQVLYDQLSTSLSMQNFDLSLEEARLHMKKRRKNIEQQAVHLYLTILLAGEKLKNKRKEYELYEKFLQLMREEYKLGMRTMLDVIDTENSMLETELEMEELAAQNQILRKDLLNFIGLDGDVSIVLEDTLAGIFSSLFFDIDRTESFDQVYGYMLLNSDIVFNEEKMYLTALKNNFEIKKLKLNQRQNLLQQRLSSMQFLENISISYELDFAGEKFFPANTSHTIAVNVLVDFGVVASNVTVSDSSSESVKSASGTADSEVLGKLNFMNRGRTLRFQYYTTAEQIEQNKKSIRKQIETWNIRMKSLMKAYTIKQNQKELYLKNDELFQVQLEIGSAKQVDYLDFLISKNEFLIELEELRYSFIDHLWKLENILNRKLKHII